METTKSEIINGRPCHEIRLTTSGYSVFMAEYLSGGEDEDAMEILMGDNLISVNVNGDQGIKFKNTTLYQRKQIEFGVKKIISPDGSEVHFSVEWYRNLPKPDILLMKKFVLEHYSNSDEKKSNKQNGGEADTQVLHDGEGQSTDTK